MTAGNQITSNIFYEDKGDYLLVSFTRTAYTNWKNRNTYADTDVLQFLFRFARNAQDGETPSTSGQDQESKYVWGCPDVFYIDDIRGV